MDEIFQQLSPFGPLSRVALFIALFFFLGIVPSLLATYLAYFMLTLPLRRNERARLFIDLIELGLKQGHTPERLIVDAASSHDPALGVRFHLLAAYLEKGMSLG